MALDRITLTNFRNHRSTKLEGTARINLLVGENGAGKTNVIEALSLFAPGRGLRRAALADMVGRPAGLRDTQDAFAVSASLERDDGAEPVTLGTGVAPERPGRRVVRVDTSEASAMSLGEWLAIAWLTPAMDRLFADSATTRRQYLDRLAVALEPAHAGIATRYAAALRERNRLLSGESEPDPAWLDSIEAQMAEPGALLAQARARLIGRLGEALAGYPDRPFARPALAYVPGGPLEAERLARIWADARAGDRAAQRTLAGPHRDELEVRMAGKDVPAAACSTGEQKAMLIAITLAHAELAAQGRPGLLLLDEVAAHLDPVRREALFERLHSGRAQVWLTGTEEAPFAGLGAGAARWRVASGSVERI